MKIKNPLAHPMYKPVQSGSFHEPFPMEFPNIIVAKKFELSCTNPGNRIQTVGQSPSVLVTNICRQRMSLTSTQKTYQHVSKDMVKTSMAKLISDKSPDFIFFTRMKHQRRLQWFLKHLIGWNLNQSETSIYLEINLSQIAVESRYIIPCFILLNVSKVNGS